MAAMKWWGWGSEGVSFTHEDKPELIPFIERVLGLKVGAPTSAPVRLEDLELAEPKLPEALRSGLEGAVGAEFVSVDRLDRVVHARGKSLRDLIRQRRGELPPRARCSSSVRAARPRSPRSCARPSAPTPW